jgi:ribosomal protein S18 acetylase RimI-like enzyme
VTRRVFGLDFSGANDAGRRIWLAEAEATGGGLVIRNCRPACELLGGGVDRASALAALRDFVAATPDAIIGCDFPFSLPRSLIAAADWPGFIAAFDHADADAFRRSCCALSPGLEPKRATDRDAKTPWCAFNIRLYHQSYHGMAGLLRPLVGSGRAAVLPMQPALSDRAWLIETCPASVLKHLGWKASYKGNAYREERRRILQLLRDRLLLRPLTDVLERRVADDPGGDALDSILAALATASALDDILGGRGNGDAIEGRVYFELGGAAGLRIPGVEPQAVEMRPARREDLPAIVGLLADDHLGRERERVEEPLPASYEAAFDAVADDPRNLLMVAEDPDGAVLGYLQMTVIAGLSFQGAERALIEDVRVDARHRGRGIGHRMLRWAVAEARARRCRLVELFVHESRTAARRFYADLGFKDSHVGMRLLLG